MRSWASAGRCAGPPAAEGGAKETMSRPSGDRGRKNWRMTAPAFSLSHNGPPAAAAERAALVSRATLCCMVRNS